VSSASEALRGDRDFLLNELKPALAAAGITYEFGYMTSYLPYELQSDSTFIEKFTAY
jgi:hypothetical protein